MPSVFDLIRCKTQEETEHGPGIYDRARNQGLDITNKADLIIQLSDEELSKEAKTLIQSTKAELVDIAKAQDVSPDGSKVALLERLLKHVVANSSNSRCNDTPKRIQSKAKAKAKAKASSARAYTSELDGDERLPRAELTSHFDTAEARLNAIRQASVEATNLAISESMSYVVVESFRPKDYNQPLEVQPAYMQRHPDTIVVFEANFPQTPYFILTAQRNAIRI